MHVALSAGIYANSRPIALVRVEVKTKTTIILCDMYHSALLRVCRVVDLHLIPRLNTGQIFRRAPAFVMSAPLPTGFDSQVRTFSSNFPEKVTAEVDRTNMESTSTSPEDFMRRIFDLMMEEGIRKPVNGECKVVNFKHPAELKECFDFTIRDEPETEERLLQLCKETFHYSVKTAHPQYYNTNFAGYDVHGLTGAWMTECLNTSQYTFEVAPVFILMEHEVLSKLRDLCGFKSGDGIFCPGGSMANMLALNFARYRINPKVKEQGMYNTKPLTIFVSDQGHYSFVKGAAFMGIGTDYVVKVKSDDNGRMIPEELDKAISTAKDKGTTPLIVVATAGTTVLGSYDPLEPMADICEKYGTWLHVDAAWGGSALLSKTYRYLLQGIHRVNSVAWCQHKMMGVPVQCSAFLLNGDERLMSTCMSAHAKYLFQQDKFYDVSYDTGDKTIQCSRKSDSLKLWLMWKAKGNNGFEAEIDHKFAISRYIAGLIKNREGFRLVQEPQCINVCFWYIPKCLRNEEETPDFWNRLHKVAPKIKAAMTEAGSLLLPFQPNGERVNFFRIAFGNARVTEESVVFALDEIDRIGKDIQM